MFLRNLEITATDVSKIGIANKNMGVKKEPICVSVFGFRRTVKIAISNPRNNAPASPIYIFAGFLFHTKNPKVPPAVTVANAAINY